FPTAAPTVTYRPRASSMALAPGAARAWTPALPPAEVPSAREVPGAVVTTAAEDLQRSLAQIVEQERARTEGTIAVLTSPGMRAQIARALGVAGPVDLRRPVVVLDAAGSKGLEFDVVVLAEPRQILKAAPAADLYVAMTRATQRLHLVHAQELPAELASAD